MTPQFTSSFLALALALSGTALAAAPTALHAEFPAYANADALKRACDTGLAQSRADLQRLEKRPADGGWLAAYDRFSARVEDRSSRIAFLSAVHPDAAIRQASEACELRWNDFFSTQGQSVHLYAAAKRAPARDDIDRELKRQLVESFDDAGVALPPTQRARAKALNDRIGELSQAFERNVRDAKVKVPATEAELAGVPEAVWKALPRDADGRVLLGLDYPTLDPVLQSADSAALRERMWRAKTDQGGAANLKLLAELTTLRKEYAALFGVESWDAFVIRRRMAQTPQRVAAFLDEVKAAVQAREMQELEVLRQAKLQHLQLTPEGARLSPWDAGYYGERVRQARFKVDQEAFRAHFPPQQSLEFCLRLLERLLGIRYQRIDSAKAWQKDVQAYAVFDASSNRRLATLWVDLYPREGKFNHAAVWGLRGASMDMNRLSEAALVVNFNRNGLTLDELETLLHELGHSVHNNLSATRYLSQAGSNVMRDFVEAPSQMLEDWVYDRQVLKLFAEVCPACKPVPDALLDQAIEARHFGKGMRQSRQHLYASYDLALYGPEQQDPLALWAKMEGAKPLGHVPGTMFPAGFAHIASGYSAGYYGYLWSLVVAEDLRTAFAANKLDPAVGQRYRQTVLANGSQRPPQQLVRDFLGRDFNAKAFFDDLKR
jgi:thimet oligopeptidase